MGVSEALNHHLQSPAPSNLVPVDPLLVTNPASFGTSGISLCYGVALPTSHAHRTISRFAQDVCTRVGVVLARGGMSKRRKALLLGENMLSIGFS